MKCSGDHKKHPCPDCYFCQWCSETRCRLCRNKGLPQSHLSLKEQIDLFEQLNHGLAGKAE